MAVPKAFISYSHDSTGHKAWVLNLATRLMAAGVDTTLDQWSLEPGADLARFMENGIAGADKVLVVCTPTYVQKANAGKGGVGYEKMIVSAELLANIDSTRIIPIVRQKKTSLVPNFLSTKLYVNFSRDEDFEAALDDLLRAIHQSPMYEKPALGANPYTTGKNPSPAPSPQPRADSMELVLGAVGHHYNKGFNYAMSLDIASFLGTSRILVEVAFDELASRGLLTRNRSGSVSLTAAGRELLLMRGLA